VDDSEQNHVTANDCDARFFTDFRPEPIHERVISNENEFGANLGKEA
jgi:hypothetical protein